MPAPHTVLRCRSGRSSGFSLVELLISVGIISLLAVIAAPVLVGGREKARAASCDENYTALVPELHVQLDELLGAGSSDAAELSIDGAVAGHAVPISHNPRKLSQDAYVDGGACGASVPTASTTCQVFLCFDGADSVLHQQFESGELRSFRVNVE